MSKFNPNVKLYDQTLENKGKEKVHVAVAYNHGNAHGPVGTVDIGTAYSKAELKTLILAAKAYVAACEKGESELMRWGKLLLEGAKTS